MTAARKLDREMPTKTSPTQARDTRHAPRAAVHVRVDMFSDHNFWSGLTMNMSDGGLFVATHNVVPVGTTLALHMELPFENEPILAIAEVRWTRAFTNQDDVPPGLGLQFVEISTSALAKIHRFVGTIREPLFFEE